MKEIEMFKSLCSVDDASVKTCNEVAVANITTKFYIRNHQKAEGEVVQTLLKIGMEMEMENWTCNLAKTETLEHQNRSGVKISQSDQKIYGRKRSDILWEIIIFSNLFLFNRSTVL